MYYEEQVINGVLHFRSNPDGPWQALTPEQLTERIVKYQTRVGVLESSIDALTDAVEDYLARA